MLRDAVIKGVAVVGTKLTVFARRVRSAKIQCAFQWYLIGKEDKKLVAISGANAASYVPQPRDVGHTLQCVCSPFTLEGTPGVKVVATSDVVSLKNSSLVRSLVLPPVDKLVLGSTIEAQWECSGPVRVHWARSRSSLGPFENIEGGAEGKLYCLVAMNAQVNVTAVGKLYLDVEYASCFLKCSVHPLSGSDEESAESVVGPVSIPKDLRTGNWIRKRRLGEQSYL